MERLEPPRVEGSRTWRPWSFTGPAHGTGDVSERRFRARRTYADINHADAIMLFGHNMAETQAVTWMRILDRLEGPNPPELVVVDPRPTPAAGRATVHLPIKNGTNVALLNAFLHEIIENGWYDREYVDAHTLGIEELESIVADCTPEWAAEICGVSAEDIGEAARIRGTAGRLLSTALQGVYQSHQATAAATWGEKTGTYTNTDRTVHLSGAGVEGHAAEVDVFHTSNTLAQQCEAHVEKLEPILEHYGEEMPTEPDRLYHQFFDGTREGGIGLVRDLHDLYLMANACDIAGVRHHHDRAGRPGPRGPGAAGGGGRLRGTDGRPDQVAQDQDEAGSAPGAPRVAPGCLPPPDGGDHVYREPRLLADSPRDGGAHGGRRLAYGRRLASEPGDVPVPVWEAKDSSGTPG